MNLYHPTKITDNYLTSMLRSPLFQKDMDQVMSSDSLTKSHVSITSQLIKRLATFRTKEKTPADNQEEIDEICFKLADTFSLYSFGKALETAKHKIEHAKKNLDSSSHP